MSITHGESGQSNSIQASSGIEVVDVSRVDEAPADLRPVDSPVKIGSKNWSGAEAVACEIIKKVQPTSVSEERRKEVIVYIQRLFKNHLGVEVLTYGSVPLKTYLPDGDIDLTAFGGVKVEDSLVDDMKFVLDQEEKNTSAELVVKDVQLIRAEVKLVKCIVQNIVVDVSFNQLGGLCTLCFLEKVDRLVGKDHLFKRSIILIKSWCYYESRILGAHHGLISTYGLETLVLYIFHIYHSTLDGPLAVLYKFLVFYSKFDWDTYGISLNGPVRLSSLPKIVVEMPEDSIGDLLLSSDFIDSCVETFSVPLRNGEQNSRGFQRRHLNIVDPMKDFNNLGRSVSKGSFYRVRSAFTYGAKKLGQILTNPYNDISKELHKFFSNTLSRHGERRKSDVNDFDVSLDNSTCDDSHKEILASRDSRSSSTKSFEELPKRTQGEQGNINQILTSHRFNGDANDLATSGISKVKISSDPLKTQFPVIYAPHLFFSKPYFQNGTTKDESESQEKSHLVEKDQHCDHPAASVTKSLNLLTDLTGDYDSHFKCFQYGKMCYEGLHPMHAMPPPPQFKQSAFSSQPHTNGFHQGPMYFVPPHLLMHGVPRGTGIYFPNMNQNPQGYRPVITGNSRPFYNNGGMIFSDPTMLERSTHEPSQLQVPMMVSFPQGYHPISPHMNGFPKANGSIVQPEGHPTGTSVVEKATPVPEKASSVSSSPKTSSRRQKAEPPALSRDQTRITLTSAYRLKDEDDFPPLSV